jgi:hypothetical protein
VTPPIPVTEALMAQSMNTIMPLMMGWLALSPPAYRFA